MFQYDPVNTKLGTIVSQFVQQVATWLWKRRYGTSRVGVPARIERTALDLESRLETWLEEDISILDSDLMIIGRQVQTGYKGIIDLLAVDSLGNVVILELKRDKTPRDVVGQVLDYAFWAKDLEHKELIHMAEQYLPSTLAETFNRRFSMDLPEVLNQEHRMCIVCSHMDSATERIVRYLSEEHHVNINIVCFSYYQTEGRELLARTFLMEQADVEQRAASRSKRRPVLSMEAFEEMADERGAGDVFRFACSTLKPMFDNLSRTQGNIALRSWMADSLNTVLSIYPGLSNSEDGVVVRLYVDRLCSVFGIDGEELLKAVGKPVDAGLKVDSCFDSRQAFHCQREEVERLASLFQRRNRD